MKLHRALTLGFMILLCLVALAYSLAIGIQAFDRRSLVALGVAVLLAAIGGIAFSWKRYFPSRR